MHLVLISIILLCQLHVEISNTALQSHQASIAHCRMLIRRPNFPKLSYFIESQLPSIVCCILISKTLQYQKSMFQYLYNLVVNKGSVFFRTYLWELAFSALVKTQKQIKYRTEPEATSFHYQIQQWLFSFSQTHYHYHCNKFELY